MTCPRAALFLVALCVAYVGFEECRLRLHCASARELPLDALEAVDDEGPVWVRARMTLQRGEPEGVTVRPGVQRIWVPCHREDDPTIVVALLELPDSDDALHRLQVGGESTIEGLARYPAERDDAPLAELLRRRGATPSPGIRIVEVGRLPRKLGPAIVTLVSGAIAALLALVGLGRIAPELFAAAERALPMERTGARGVMTALPRASSLRPPATHGS